MSVTYRPAPSVARIAEDLIARHHHELGDARIEYVFRSDAQKSGGKEIWGKARKVSGLNAFLAQQNGPDETPVSTELDFFVIEIAEDVWATLDQAKRTALVDHELCHCAVEWDDKKDQLVLSILPHDLEEFGSVVERHGLWRKDVEAFADSLHYRQLSIVDAEVAP